MAELNAKLNCKKDGVTEEITAYTTLDEVQNQGIDVKIGGVSGYIKYGDIADINASQLNCKVGGTTYKVHKTAIPPISVTFRCFDVETEQQISAIKYPLPDDGILYLNNENAPSVAGYDFVMMDGIKHSGVVEDDVFDVWYISQSVPDRTKTGWSRYFSSTTDTTIVANTYSARDLGQMCRNNTNIVKLKRINASNVTNMTYMFYPCSKVASVPQMDTSKVTNMSYTFAYCRGLTSMPEMDTSKVTNMKGMFNNCSGLTSIDWEIDMSSCTDCDFMFDNCPATNIRLKNVPSSLDLSDIGTTNYTVVNYI